MYVRERFRMDESTTKHRDLVATSIQVYQLLGHEIEQVIAFDEARTDLKIRSDQDELWIVRCDTTDAIDAETVRTFILSCAIEGPHQLALVTTGEITPDATEYVEGHPIYILDVPMLEEYMNRAERRIIENALTPVEIPEEVGMPPEEPQEEVILEVQMKTCPFCTAEVPIETIICDFCSRNLVVTAPLSRDGTGMLVEEVPEPMFSTN